MTTSFHLTTDFARIGASGIAENEWA